MSRLIALMLLPAAACSDYRLHNHSNASAGGDADTATVTETGVTDTATTDTGQAPDALYAHSGDTLYAVDPSTFALTEIGPLRSASGSSPSSVTDLAIDGDGRMYAVSTSATYSVDPATGTLTELGQHDGWSVALSFLPDGTLVAGGDSSMWTVNLSTGAFTSDAEFSSWAFAGDMVELPDGLLYCAMSAPGDENGDSSLVVWDPSSRSIVSSKPTGIGALWGVGYANGTLFGFSHEGDIYTIDSATGHATKVASPGVAFDGAATNPWKWDR